MNGVKEIKKSTVLGHATAGIVVPTHLVVVGGDVRAPKARGAGDGADGGLEVILVATDGEEGGGGARPRRGHTLDRNRGGMTAGQNPDLRRDRAQGPDPE